MSGSETGRQAALLQTAWKCGTFGPAMSTPARPHALRNTGELTSRMSVINQGSERTDELATAAKRSPAAIRRGHRELPWRAAGCDSPFLSQGAVLKQGLRASQVQDPRRHQPPSFRQHKFRRSPGPGCHYGHAVTHGFNKATGIPS
jgi:hypothetical protein